ncbi:hypothetical protein [Myceligenerans pegani]|uniref:Uncharacterized protein n=1 Tax=Myceligenerans pegani TaxID=2776917 RepID=A0ABR9N1J6_9MICO|nr:hypothetical protein [Myceligenerans sp. TRM 65318]MBE1877529.1 hypothetical protein [Myceligenerans sp. TRM 65318]MBE3019800.1 hypothetical protein [Myceligenerans sp. TRM 65318]
MRRVVIVVVTAVVLVVAAWIGWPRDDGLGRSDGIENTGNVAEQDGRQDTATAPEGADPSAEPPTDAVAEGDVDPGDPALEVVEEPEFDADGAPTEQVEATWDDDVRTAAVSAATAAVTAFSDVDQSAEAWWRGLSPLLTPQARVVYEDVDPRNVPVRQVTGPASVVDESSTLLTEVTVPTDVGAYTVMLVRADGGSPWLTEQIRPPS